MKKVGPGFVAVAVMSGFGKDMLDHIAGGGLSVGSCHYYDLHVPGGNREDIFGDLHCDSARKSCSAASGFPQDCPGEFTGRDRKYGLYLIRFFHFDQRFITAFSRQDEQIKSRSGAANRIFRFRALNDYSSYCAF